jgi:hypothetical protein
LKQADLTRQRQELLGRIERDNGHNRVPWPPAKNHWNYTNAHHAASPLKTGADYSLALTRRKLFACSAAMLTKARNKSPRRRLPSATKQP